MDEAPRVFVSYSHDNQAHKAWVLTLATRFMANGVNVLLDQWDLGPGAVLPRFMETGLTSARRVLAVCSEPYVQKANNAKGGVAYEKMILSGKILSDATTNWIIPDIRNSSA